MHAGSFPTRLFFSTYTVTLRRCLTPCVAQDVDDVEAPHARRRTRGAAAYAAASAVITSTTGHTDAATRAVTCGRGEPATRGGV
jgi:hypothetical protein